MAAIEFAILVPTVVIMVYTVAELSNAVDNRNKVSALARTLGDIVSQGDIISSTDMSMMAGAAVPLLAPFPASRATMSVLAVGIAANGSKQVPYVCSSWSNATKPKTGKSDSLVIPTNFQRVGARFVLIEVEMPYVPLFAQVIQPYMPSLDLNYIWRDNVAWPIRGGRVYPSSTDSEVVLPGGKDCAQMMK